MLGFENELRSHNEAKENNWNKYIEGTKVTNKYQGERIQFQEFSFKDFPYSFSSTGKVKTVEELTELLKTIT